MARRGRLADEASQSQQDGTILTDRLGSRSLTEELYLLPAFGARCRVTGGKDREQVVCWCREFCVDVGEQSSTDLFDADSWDASRFGDGHFTFWEAPDGTPVSMAAATSIVGGMVRVDPVYTPAHLRGHGYAGP